MTQKTLIPSVQAFKKLSEDEQIAAYRAAAKSLELAQKKGLAPYAQKRMQLLKWYQEAADWSPATLAALRVG